MDKIDIKNKTNLQIKRRRVAEASSHSPFPISRSAIRNPQSAFQRGFTLIEMIMVIVILSIASAISIKFLTDSLRIYTMTVNQKTLLDEGKLALERMCRDIRDAKAISGVTASSITFIRNNATFFDSGLPGDLVGETITFRLNGSVLEKVKASPSTTIPLANNASAFVVTNATNEIQLRLTLLMLSGENVTLQTKVYPRNLDRDITNTYKNFFQNWQEKST